MNSQQQCHVYYPKLKTTEIYINKRNKLINPAAQRNLTGIMLGEKSQTQNCSYCSVKQNYGRRLFWTELLHEAPADQTIPKGSQLMLNVT